MIMVITLLFILITDPKPADKQLKQSLMMISDANMDFEVTKIPRIHTKLILLISCSQVKQSPYVVLPKVKNLKWKTLMVNVHNT